MIVKFVLGADVFLAKKNTSRYNTQAQIKIMKIIVNGNQKELISQATLTYFIDSSCKSPQHVIAELNGVIVKKNQWNECVLKDGDSLELVNFVGGG